MIRGPTLFEPVNNPHGNFLQDLTQNLFYVRGISPYRSFTRIIQPTGLNTYDPNAIYLKLDEYKTFRIKDFFSALGKVLLIATGIFPLLFLTLRLIDFAKNRHRYIVVESTPDALIRQNTSRCLLSISLPKGDSLIPAIILEPVDLQAATISSLSNERFLQITVAQYATLNELQRKQFEERIKTVALERAQVGQPKENGTPFLPKSLSEISLAQFGNIDPAFICDHLEEIPVSIWQLASKFQQQALTAAISDMSQSRFDSLVGSNRIQDLEALDCGVYQEKITRSYLLNLSKAQTLVLLHVLTPRSLLYLNKDHIPFINMKTVAPERIALLFTTEDDSLLGERLQQLTNEQIDDCFVRTPKLIGSLLHYFSEEQLWSIRPEHLVSLSDHHLYLFLGDTIGENICRFNDAQISALLPRITPFFRDLPRDRVQKFDYSKIDGSIFSMLFFYAEEIPWYNGLDEAFIIARFNQELLAIFHLIQLPDAIFQKLDFTKLSFTDKDNLINGFEMFTLKGIKKFTKEFIQAKCSPEQKKILTE